jgi:hypothetical protein
MRITNITALCLLLGLALTLRTGGAAAATKVEKDGSSLGKETFSALAFLPTGIGPAMRGAGATANVTINIESYSSDEDARQLRGALVDGGPDRLLKVLENMKSIGHIERVGAVSFYDFKYIRSTPTDTGRRIIAVTDRPIGFLEIYFATRSEDYKFGILQLDLRDDKKGREKGVGALIFAAKIKLLKGTQIEIENFGIDPIQLEGVRQL